MHHQYLLLTTVALFSLASAHATDFPTCLASAVDKQANPAAVPAVCETDKQPSFLSNLAASCSGDDLATAYAHMVEICGEKGVELAALPQESSKGGAQGDSSGNGNGNGIAPSLIFLITGLATTCLTGFLFL